MYVLRRYTSAVLVATLKAQSRTLNPEI